MSRVRVFKSLLPKTATRGQDFFLASAGYSRPVPRQKEKTPNLVSLLFPYFKWSCHFMVLVVYVHHLVHLYILSLPPQVPSPHRLNVESSSLCSTQVIINFVCIQCFCSVAKLCPTLCTPWTVACQACVC